MQIPKLQIIDNEDEPIETKKKPDPVQIFKFDMTTISTFCAFFGVKSLIGAEIIAKVNPMKIKSLRKRAKAGTYKIDEKKKEIFDIWREMKYSVSALSEFSPKGVHLIAFSEKHILEIRYANKEYMLVLFDRDDKVLKELLKSYCFDGYTCGEDKDEDFFIQTDSNGFDRFIEAEKYGEIAKEWGVKAELLKHAKKPIFESLKEKINGVYGLDDYAASKSYAVRIAKSPKNVYFVLDGDSQMAICGGGTDFVIEKLLSYFGR